MKPSILFIFHNAEATGATIELYRRVQALEHKERFRLLFLFRSEGAYVSKLNKYGEVFILDKNKDGVSVFQRAVEKLIPSMSGRGKTIHAIRRKQVRLIYANTVLSSDMIDPFINDQTTLIWHFHELELAVNAYGPERIHKAKDAEIVLANSEATKTFLKEKAGVPENKIQVFTPLLPELKLDEKQSQNIKEKFGLDKETFIVGTSGTVMSRKGVAEFLQIARIVSESVEVNKDVKFLWLGNTKGLKEELDYDISRMALEEKVIFTGQVENPQDYYRHFDVFISTSKEESYGLACAEAAQMGVPVICFDKTGGIVTLVQNAGGEVIPYLNVNAYAKCILKLMKDEHQLLSMQNAAKEFRQNYDMQSDLQKWNLMIQQNL